MILGNEKGREGGRERESSGSWLDYECKGIKEGMDEEECVVGYVKGSSL